MGSRYVNVFRRADPSVEAGDACGTVTGSGGSLVRSLSADADKTMSNPADETRTTNRLGSPHCIEPSVRGIHGRHSHDPSGISPRGSFRTVGRSLDAGSAGATAASKSAGSLAS